MKFLILVSFLIVHMVRADKVIYQLEPNDYYRMPMIHNFDPMTSCRGRAGGVYCTVNADIVSDKPSELLDMMKGYSAVYTTHFNYTDIIYGLCVTKTCKQFYDGDNSQAALWNITEACLNDSFTREYDLKVRTTDVHCYHENHTFKLDYVDKAILLTFALILGLNLVGSLYDFFRDESKPANKYLLMFSIRTGWRRLVEPLSTKPQDLELLSLNGLRALNAVTILFGHTILILVICIYNPEGFEWMFEYKIWYIIHNGNLLMSIFFTISGFLLAYNMEQVAEKEDITWISVLKHLRSRWLRFSPAKIVVLMGTIVWYKFLPIGPFFGMVIEAESEDCRRCWLHHVLYVGNLCSSSCNLHTWSLMADFQLYIYGLAIILLFKTKRLRNIAMLALGLAGAGMSAYLTYTYNMEGAFVQTPRSYMQFFYKEDMFKWHYTPALTNALYFVVGMAFGFLVYSLQKNNLTNGDYKKYRMAYYATFAGFLLIMLCGTIVYRYPRPSVYFRALYLPIVRPLLALLVGLIILGAVCKCENQVRGFLESKYWTPFFRISYSLYLVQISVLRYAAGTTDMPFHFNLFNMVYKTGGLSILSTIAAVLLYLLVEQPFSGLVALIFPRNKSTHAKEELIQKNEHAKVADKTD